MSCNNWESHFGTNRRDKIEDMKRTRIIMKILWDEIPKDDFDVSENLDEKVREKITDDKRFDTHRIQVANSVRKKLLNVEHRNFDEKTQWELLAFLWVTVLRNKDWVIEWKIPAQSAQLFWLRNSESYINIHWTEVIIIPLDRMNAYIWEWTRINPEYPILPQIHKSASSYRMFKKSNGVTIKDFYGKLYDIKKEKNQETPDTWIVGEEMNLSPEDEYKKQLSSFLISKWIWFVESFDGNDTYFVSSYTANKLWLSSEDYYMTIFFDEPHEIFSWVFTKVSDDKKRSDFESSTWWDESLGAKLNKIFELDETLQTAKTITIPNILQFLTSTLK